jgi:hypothetical protein
MIFPILGIGFFISIMIATILLSGMHNATIYLMHLFRFYKKGSLICEKRNYISGSGAHMYREVYIYLDSKGEQFVNMQIFLRLLLISLIPGFAVAGLIATTV